MHFSLPNTLKKNLNSIIILSAITLFSYIFSLNNQFVWDDEQFIYNNSYVKNFESTKIFTQNTIAGAGESSTYYRPLTTFSFAIDHAIWGLNPLGFHLTNTLLHLGAGIALFFYLRTLKFSRLSSLTISSIFLVHPIQTEAVIYANSRGDSMYAFFAMISLLTFALLLKKKFPVIKIYDLEIILGKKTLFSLTTIGYLFAILGKEIGIATLGLLGLTLLFSQLQFNKKITIKKILSHKTGLISLASSALIAVGYLLFRIKVIAIPTSQNIFFAGSAYGDSIFVRLHTFTKALWTYFQFIIYPYPLHMERDLEIITQPISVWLIATILLIIGLITLSIYEYKKQKSFFIIFGSFWFLCMLTPVSGIIPVNGLIYEHWLYLPIIGFFIALYGLKQIMIPKQFQEKTNTFLQLLLFIVISIYIFLTIRQNYIWGNPIRFYKHTLAFSSSPRLHNNLAMAYADNQEYENAIEQYTKAIELGDYYSQSHHNLANTYLAQGELELAKKEYRTAIKMNEDFMPAYYSLITILIEENDYENISSLLNKMEKMTPDNFEIKYFKAQNLIDWGKIDEGLQILRDMNDIPQLDIRFKTLINDTIKRYE